MALVCVAGLSGCATTDTQIADNGTNGGPKTKIFWENYERIWKATQIALAHYPLKAYDVDSGTVETEYITGDNVWIPPHESNYVPGGYRYKINVRVLKGKKDGDKAVRLVVLKQVEKRSDFFSNFEKYPSDGLEEIALLYRIQRELNFLN